MAYSWKILDGTNYIAKTGTAGAAGALDAPKLLTTTALTSGKNVLGTGSYVWPAGYAGPTGLSIYGDGHVRLLGDTTTSQQPFMASGGAIDVCFTQWAGIALMGANLSANYIRCTFDLVSFAATNCFMSTYGGCTFTDCTFVNVGASISGGGAGATFNNCLFYNSVLFVTTGIMTGTNCYLNPGSGLGGADARSSFTNCNVDPLTVIGTNRGLKVGSGAWGNGQAQAGCTACIQQAPQFNSVANGDYTLKPTSPHLAQGIGPSHLGAAIAYTTAYTGAGADASPANTGLASSAGGTVPLLSASGDAMQVNSLGGVVIKPTAGGSFVSVLTSGVLTLDPAGSKEMSRLELVAGMNLNSDFQSSDPFVPALQNNNVLDFNNGTAGAADRKPNRLSYRMRWSTIANPDVNTPGHWVTGNTWVEMEYFAKPAYNAAGPVGNAAPAYNPANALPVLCRTFQLELTLRNNYGA